MIGRKSNEDAVPGDRVSGEQLRGRVQRAEGVICTNHADKTRDTIATKWTGDQEGYTPAIYIDSVYSVMGSINIDPASNKYANQTVKAELFFTKDDDGLKKSWNGKVFLNPPYSQPEINHW